MQLTEMTRSRRGFIRPIEGARGVAALSVLAFHVGQFTPGSEVATLTGRLWLGVPLFFVISGFLLYRPFARAAVHGAEWPSLRRYGRARLLRIFPAYWAALTVAFLVSATPWGTVLLALAVAAAIAALVRRSPAWLAVAAAAALASDLAGGASWDAASNYLLLSLPTGHHEIVAPAWSLCVEISFYALLPLIAAGAAAAARGGVSAKRRAARLAIALSSALFVSPVYFLVVGTKLSWRGEYPALLPGFLDQFALGMLVAVFLEVRGQLGATVRRSLLASSGMLVIAGNVFCRPGALQYATWGGWVLARLMALAFALMLVAVVASGDANGVLGRFLGWRPVAFWGSISYGVYLWHWIIAKRLATLGLWGASAWLDLFVTIVVAGLIAAVSWWCLEKPLLRLKGAGLVRPRERPTSESKRHRNGRRARARFGRRSLAGSLRVGWRSVLRAVSG